MKTPQALLKEIAAIRTMERGSLSPMKSGRYYNHQTWQDGRNLVRYVPSDEVASLRKAMAGYRRFCELTRQFAELAIQRSRTERKIRNSALKPNKSKK